jgi:hypothetical protein
MALPPIKAKIGADTKGLEDGLDRAGRSVGDFKAKSRQMALDFAKVASAMTVAAAAIGAGILKAANEAANAGVEIRDLARVAGIGTTEFQKMAAASRSVGVEQEKLSDILKDVNDKFGDFAATGAGPLVDFFEQIAPKVGVTADEFARLSGPEALQLYVSSLEEAGVSQQQMTFYMEALASDATRLLPLLRDNGAQIQYLGNEAERTGRILSAEMIDNAVELDRELTVLAQTLKTQATQAVLEHKEELIALITFITKDVFPAFLGLLDFIARGVEGWKILGRAARDAGADMMKAIEDGQGGGSAGRRDRRQAATGENLNMTNDPGFNPVGSLLPEGMTNDPGFNPVGSLLPLGQTEGSAFDPSGGLLPPSKDDEEEIVPGLSSASAVADDLAARLEALTDGLATEQELINDWYSESKETLAEALAAELLTEAEHKEALARLEEEHQDRINAIKEMGAAANLAVVLGSGEQILRAIGQNSEKALKIAQIFGAAEALISTYQGAAKALAGPFPGNLAAAASVISAGIGFVSAIKSVNSSGGGAASAPSSSSAGSFSSAQAPAQPTQQVNLTLIGDSFNARQVEEVARRINMNTDNGLRVRGR